MLPFSLKVRAAILSISLAAIAAPAGAQWTFTDVTTAAGVNVSHSIDNLFSSERETAAGVAAADYNRDGWMDLYFLGGNNGHNYLFHNNGDGTFTDVAVAAGVDLTGTLSNGACFADWDGDGDADLFVGALEGATASFFSNNGDGTFTDVTVSTGVSLTTDCFSSTFGDYDNDGDLDLFVAHWGVTPQGTGHIWRNNGDGTFTDVDALVGYTNFPPAGGDNTFTYNLADINSDGWVDLLVSSDFLTSHVYTNDGDGTFTNATNAGVIDDENGMGGSVADYDNDGDLDWFVTSIYNAPVKTGNRLYENDGAGNFSDASTTAGVDNGLWGWGSTFQDFNNDGWIDIYHVNGWRNGYTGNRSRLFVSDQDKTFTGMAASVNADHPGQGRSVCALDYDNDGDLDLF
ncbi:MAG: VCBS repeat-containing protein, partial [Gemmatimonadetes bacterium]|nr:VCBS repeat-containing protein [Gemmatimonadota bacterium]